MKQLITTIQMLQGDPMFAVKVEYQDEFQRWITIVNNAGGAQLSEKHGSVEGFFEDLKNRGLYTIRITPRKRNGSNAGIANYKPAPGFSPFVFTVDPPTQNTVQDLPPRQPQPQPKAIVHDAFPIAGQGTGLMAGLNMMEVAHKTYDYPRVLAENTELKAKNERLQDELLLKKEELLKKDYSGDRASANADMLKSAIPLITQLLSAKMGAAAAGELNAPAGADLSPIKQQFIQIIRTADQGLIEDLYYIGVGMANQEFSEALDALMDAHKIRPEHAV